MRTSKMRREIELKKGWVFTGRDGKAVKVDLPHTWNAVDGQDGGNDYYEEPVTTALHLQPRI